MAGTLVHTSIIKLMRILESSEMIRLIKKQISMLIEWVDCSELN